MATCASCAWWQTVFGAHLTEEQRATVDVACCNHGKSPSFMRLTRRRDSCGHHQERFIPEPAGGAT